MRKIKAKLYYRYYHYYENTNQKLIVKARYKPHQRGTRRVSLTTIVIHGFYPFCQIIIKYRANRGGVKGSLVKGDAMCALHRIKRLRKQFKYKRNGESPCFIALCVCFFFFICYTILPLIKTYLLLH